MAAFSHHILTGIYVFFFCLQLGLALQCYTCTSARDEYCDDRFSVLSQATVRFTNCENSPILQIPGVGPNTHCGKYKRKDVTSHDYITRGCVPENYCRLVKSSMSECELCEEERCNSATGLMPSVFLYAVTSVFIYAKL